MVITRAWIHRCATGQGGWTKAQLAVLGVNWPPPKGWLSSLIGRHITDTQHAAFEAHGLKTMPLYDDPSRAEGAPAAQPCGSTKTSPGLGHHANLPLD